MHFITKRGEFGRLWKAAIALLPALFWILVIFAFDEAYIALLTLICAAIHELSHVIAIIALKKGFAMRGAYNGLRISVENGLSYKEQLIAAAAGPLGNIITALITFFMLPRGGYAEALTVLSLLTGLSNLIPIRGYDGYKIMRSLISLGRGWNRAESVCRAVSFFFTTDICFFSLYLIAKFDGGYFIFLVFFSYFMQSI